MIRTYRCRAKLSGSGHEALSRVFGMCAELYNACLEERIDCYRKTGRSPTLYDQYKALTEVRADLPEYGALSVQVLRGAVHRIDKAYQSFFRRVREKEKAGFPRYKSARRWRTIEINDQCRQMLKRRGDRLSLKIKGLPRIELKTNRELPPNAMLKAIRITRKPLRTEVALSCRLPDAQPPETEYANPVGIDAGITNRLALSNGETVRRREIDRKRIIRLQRSVSRKQKGSNNRTKAAERLAKAWQRVTDEERDYLHRLSAEMVGMYDFIAVEKLRIRNMVRNRHLARSIAEQSWGKFTALLDEKAESAGVRLVYVNPGGTSQECASCGEKVRKGLAVRVHRCTGCGYEADRDINAAINILHRGLSSIAGGKLSESRMVGRMEDKRVEVGPAQPGTVSEVVNLTA